MDLAGKTLLITGIGGFIGQQAARRAMAEGMTVRGLEKSAVAAEHLRAAGADVRVGDTTDVDAALAACQGADVILHTAAVIREGGDFGLFRRVNVQGTMIMAEAARAAGAPTFVHLSSVMVYGFDYPRLITEDGPRRGENNPYCQTKIEGEDALAEFSRAGGPGVIVIRPGDVYGPGSIPWVVRPLQLMRKGLFALPDGGHGVINHVYVDNLIDAIFLAIAQQAHDQTFNVTDGVETTWRDYFTRLAAAAGLRKPFALPTPAIRALGAVVSTLERLAGRQPSMQPESVDFVRRKHAVSIAKAQRALGYEPAVNLDDGMGRVQAWLGSAEGQAVVWGRGFED